MHSSEKKTDENGPEKRMNKKTKTNSGMRKLHNYRYNSTVIQARVWLSKKGGFQLRVDLLLGVDLQGGGYNVNILTT